MLHIHAIKTPCEDQAILTVTTTVGGHFAPASMKQIFVHKNNDTLRIRSLDQDQRDITTKKLEKRSNITGKPTDHDHYGDRTTSREVSRTTSHEQHIRIIPNSEGEPHSQIFAQLLQ
ncbi:hypothetical protein Dimus_035778 [Dionaea muscipula]